MTARSATTRPWHSAAWLLWAVAAAASVQLAPSPVYVALIVGIAWLVVEVHALDGPYRRAFPALLAIGCAFALLRVGLAALTTHNGTDVLFSLPEATLPRLLGGFTVGGSVELGVILQVLSESFAVIGMMAVFGAFNAIASHYELVQATPRAFYEVGLVTTVALAFVPSTIESVAAVREADRARTGGRVVKRGRLHRMLIPVLERGMERAIALSESMDSRGFAHGGASSSERFAGWSLLGALLALTAGFAALVGRAPGVGALLGLVGLGLLVGAVAITSRASARQRYRPRRMRRADWAMVGVSLLAPLGLGALSVAGFGSLIWRPSPIAWPEFQPVVALALVPLLAPLVRRPVHHADVVAATPISVGAT